MTATLNYPTGTAQLCANWSDESQRKMTTKSTLWGTHGGSTRTGRISRSISGTRRRSPTAIAPVWNVRYTTDMTEAIVVYLRGEEYSAQLDAFVQRAIARKDRGRERLRLGHGD